MNFQRISLLFAQLIILINRLVDIVHPVEEDCYRGELYDYDNPCYGQPGQPEKLDLCPQGHKLVERCTESCKVCDSETFADSFNNCPSCKPCLTECPKGQVIIRNCSSDANAECGCPLCQEHDPSTCPPVLPCICEPSTPFPEQTIDWNMSTRLMATSGPGEEQNFASCHQYWIPLAVVIIVILVAAVLAVIILGRWVYRFKRNAHYEAIPGSSEDPEAHNIEMTKYQEDLKMKDKEICQLKEELKDLKKRLQTLSTQDVPASLPTKTNRQDSAQGGNSEKLGQAGNSKDAAPIAESEDLEDGGKSSTKANSKDLVKGGQEIAEPSDDTDKKVTKQEELNKKDEEIQVVESPVEEQQKESPNLSPEAGLSPSQSDGGVVLQSGKVNQLKPEPVERQESVSTRNKMETAFQYLSENLSEEWKGVGRRLKITEAKLSTLTKDNADSTENAIYKMFIHWKHIRGDDASYKTLIKALASGGRKDLADDLRSGKAFQTSSQQSS